jgi:mono/diheme cytochrome c family protein
MAAFLLVLTSVVVLVPVKAVTVGDAVKGKAVFTKNQCVACHLGGENTMDPAHPIKGAAFSQKYKDDQVLESTIRKGFPQEGMPSFTKALINDSDMKDLVAYVRSLSKSSKNPR